MAAGANPSSWENLPQDVMSGIARFVLCEWDRVRMAAVCRSWRARLAATPPPPPPPELPLLLLPSNDLTRLVCILSGGSSHQQYHDGGVRYFGSYDRGYLFCAVLQTRLHRLLDLHTAGMRALPDVVGPHPTIQGIYNMSILAAVLSAPPDDPGCVVAGIVAYRWDAEGPLQRRRAFWRMGDRVAYDTVPRDHHGAEVLEDIVYRGDGFFDFLTKEEHILASAPTFFQDGDEPLRGVAVSSTTRRFVPRDTDHDHGSVVVRARYLVESRGELLMAVPFAPDLQLPTSAFKVFSALGPEWPNDDGTGGVYGYPYSWRVLDTLGGRMLFVGRGCSRSFETADYPGFEDGVYFLDDRSFYDDEMMFRGVNQIQYPCSDNGKWSEGPPPDVERFFPEHGPSSHSSPTWVLKGVVVVDAAHPATPPITIPSMAEALPADVVPEISRHLPCHADRIHMALALRSWGDALRRSKEPPLRPQLPWLFFSHFSGTFVHCTVCSKEDKAFVHVVRVPEPQRSARYFGTHEGRWVLMAATASGTSRNMAVQVTTGETYLLPNKSMDPRGVVREGMVLLAAVLSSSPGHGDCLGMGIIRNHRDNLQQKRVVFFIPGREHATDPFEGEIRDQPEDVLHFGGSFFVLTRDEHIHRWRVVSDPNGKITMETPEGFYFPEDREYGHQVTARYLLRSRNAMIMVVKLSLPFDRTHKRTAKFRIFQMKELQSENADEAESGYTRCFWQELTSLDGRALFVGRGCSRPYELSQFPQLKEGVFFADDRSYEAPAANQLFHCADNGRWSAPPPTIHRYFPNDEEFSSTSPPIWILP